MKYLLLFLSMVCLLGCKQKRIEIPFKFDAENYIMPQLTLRFFKGKKAIDIAFGIDTGAEQNHFFNNSIEKLWDSMEEYKNLFAEKNIDVDSLQEGYAASITYLNVQCGNYVIPKISILNSPECKDDENEGLIGYKVLKDFGIAVFDFKRKILILGEKVVVKNILPMTYVKVLANVLGQYTSLLSIPVEINGVEKNAVIDTGFSSGGDFVILVSNNVEKSENTTVKIGNFLYKDVLSVRFLEADPVFPGAADMFGAANDFIIIGNAFFQNHRIQLDFENMTFAMD